MWSLQTLKDEHQRLIDPIEVQLTMEATWATGTGIYKRTVKNFLWFCSWMNRDLSSFHSTVDSTKLECAITYIVEIENIIKTEVGSLQKPILAI